jgi:pimeloyl-ACP methyl ester carboxylesterase
MEVRQIELAVEDTGRGSPVVLVHGTGVNSALWGGVPSELARARRVLSYDRRGFGRSPGPPVRDYAVHARDLIELLARETGPATVVGWSAGGIIALDAALQHPELVSSLVLYEPPLHAKRHPSADLIGTILRVQVKRRILHDERGAARRFLRFVFAETDGTNAMDRWPAEFLAEVDRDAHAALLEIDAGTGEHLSPAAIASLLVPVLGVVGARTSSMPRAAMERLHRLLPDMPIQVLDGGHGTHLDDASAFARAILGRDV